MWDENCEEALGICEAMVLGNENATTQHEYHNALDEIMSLLRTAKEKAQETEGGRSRLWTCGYCPISCELKTSNDDNIQPYHCPVYIQAKANWLLESPAKDIPSSASAIVQTASQGDDGEKCKHSAKGGCKDMDGWGTESEYRCDGTDTACKHYEKATPDAKADGGGEKCPECGHTGRGNCPACDDYEPTDEGGG